MTGKIDNWYDMGRLTPHMQAHSTAIAGLTITQGGDNRFYNNIFVGQGMPGGTSVSTTDPKKSIKGFGLWVYDARNSVLQTGGNVYYNGARPHAKEVTPLVLAEVNPKFMITGNEAGVQLQITLEQAMQKAATTLVTTELLGNARVPGLPYQNPDGSPVRVDTDYFGRKRNPAAPTAGPFENPGTGPLSLKVR
jgi:hypothetical protein